MADNEIRNPAKAYFKWKMPVITKSEDDWNFWNTEDKYNRTMFIGYNDTTTPHVASLFLIVDGKAIQAVGDDVIARIAGLEVNTAQALADIQELIARVNAQQGEISNLQQECERILAQANDAVEIAQTWAEGSDADVADLGGEHSAKGWAQKATEIVSSGLPSEATFDHLTVTGSSKFGQDPDRENQPGLEIESTGEIQAYRTVNMMNGATVSYDETVEMPWSDSSNKVPNTAWVQQAVQHGSIDPNSELTVKSISTSTNFNLWFKDNPDESGRTKSYANLHAERGSNGTSFYIDVFDNNFGSQHVYKYTMRAGNNNVASFTNPGSVTWLAADKLNLRSSLSDVVISAGSGRFVTLNSKVRLGGSTFAVDATASPATAAFGVTPTVPDIADAADSSDKVPNTKWVQAAITAGGGGGGGTGGAVSSVNGKTGAVVLSGQDIKTDPNAANTIYQDWAELSSMVSGKQSEIVQDSVLSLNSITLANSSTGDVGTLKLTSQDGEIEFRPNGTYLGGITGRSGTGMLIMGNDLHIGYQFNSPTGILVSRTNSKATHNFATEFTSTVSCSVSIAADDNSQQLATTQWVNAAIAAAGGGGGGSGAVASVNGKTGTVVLSGEDINLHPTVGGEAYPSVSDVIDSISSYLPSGVASDNKLIDNSSLWSYLVLYQPQLTAGEGITISTENVISATGGGGGAITSVNGNTGAVVLTGDNVRIHETSTVTLNAALAGKQDSITETSDLTANSITAKGTVTAHILVAGDGYEGSKFTCNADALLDGITDIGWRTGRLRCMSNEYNWLFDFNKSASAGNRIRFNDDVTILSTMPDATDSSNIVPTTAWVQGVAGTKANINADNFSVAGKAVLAGMGVPSAKYIDLTLGASGTTYTAPANGWFYLMRRAHGATQSIQLSYNNISIIAWGNTTDNIDIALLLPVSAGGVVTVDYTATGPETTFRFIYADGSQPVT